MSCHRPSRGLWRCMHKSQQEGWADRFGSLRLECCFPMERSSRTLHRTTIGPRGQHGSRAGPAQETRECRRRPRNRGVAHVQISFSFSFYSILKFLLSSFSSQLLVWLGRGYSAYTERVSMMKIQTSYSTLLALARHCRFPPAGGAPPDRISAEAPVAQRVNAVSPTPPSCAPFTDPAAAASMAPGAPATSQRGGGEPHAPGCFSAALPSAGLFTGATRATAKSAYSLYDDTSGPNPRPNETAVAAEAREHIPWPGKMTAGDPRTSAPVHSRPGRTFEPINK